MGRCPAKKELLLELSSEGCRRTELASPPVQLEGLRPNTESLGPSCTVCINVALATGLSDFRKVCCGSEHTLQSSAGAEVPQSAQPTRSSAVSDGAYIVIEPRLSFVTPQEDLSSGAMTSLTAAMKDLGSIKEHLGCTCASHKLTSSHVTAMVLRGLLVPSMPARPMPRCSDTSEHCRTAGPLGRACLLLSTTGAAGCRIELV